MPGTQHLGSGRTGRTARWLAAALLLPVLAACGGGGGDSGGDTPAAGQGGNGEPTEMPRNNAGGNPAAFRNAGNPKATVRQTGKNNLALQFHASSTSSESTSETPSESPSAQAQVVATVSDVSDCEGSAGIATPASQDVTLTNGESPPVTFSIPPLSGAGDRTICYTLTIDGAGKRDQAQGTIHSTSTSGPSGQSSGGEGSPSSEPSAGPGSEPGGTPSADSGGGTP